MLRLEKERERAGLSRSALARLALMHPATVGQIESGYIGRPYPGQLSKLAAALGFEDEPARLLEEVSGDDGQ
jgi:transcriptional regulator with XRE-family HTH domain